MAFICANAQAGAKRAERRRTVRLRKSGRAKRRRRVLAVRMSEKASSTVTRTADSSYRNSAEPDREIRMNHKYRFGENGEFSCNAYGCDYDKATAKSRV